MRLVLATDGFCHIGGSETYLLTLAEQLQRLGHDVVIHAVKTGAGVVIGRRVRIQNNVVLAPGTTIEDDVFCAPNLTTTDDAFDGRYGERVLETVLRRGCRIGASVTILPGLEIGADAVVGAASLVTRSVPAGSVCYGSPARVVRTTGSAPG